MSDGLGPLFALATGGGEGEGFARLLEQTARALGEVSATLGAAGMSAGDPGAMLSALLARGPQSGGTAGAGGPVAVRASVRARPTYMAHSGSQAARALASALLKAGG